MSFFEDDTLDVVRQHIALAVNSYPTRLYVEAHVSLPAEYYADPRHWEALFLRVSLNGSRVDKELFKVYLEQVRGIGVVERSRRCCDERAVDAGRACRTRRAAAARPGDAVRTTPARSPRQRPDARLLLRRLRQASPLWTWRVRR